MRFNQKPTQPRYKKQIQLKAHTYTHKQPPETYTRIKSNSAGREKIQKKQEHGYFLITLRLPSIAVFSPKKHKTNHYRLSFTKINIKKYIKKHEI